MSRRIAHAPVGAVRIVGGHWRGTRLPVVAADGLRPSSDRVRETLFNWLQPALQGARVLDAFAGTGVLGLEALSRGAAAAVLVEQAPAAVAALRAAVARLDAAAEVVQADALAWLAQPPRQQFDLVFLDPPFTLAAWPRVWPLLAAHLTETAWVYVESPRAAPALAPAGLSLHRRVQTREADAALYRREAAAGDAATLATALASPDGRPVA